MELSNEAKESLNIIRDRIDSESVLWSKEEKTIHIPVIFHAITRKVLGMNCDGCIISAIRIIRNYVKFYEPATNKPTPKKQKVEKNIKTDVVKITESSIDEFLSLDDLTKKELKKLISEAGQTVDAKMNKAGLINIVKTLKNGKK